LKKNCRIIIDWPLNRAGPQGVQGAQWNWTFPRYVPKKKIIAQ